LQAFAFNLRVWAREGDDDAAVVFAGFLFAGFLVGLVVWVSPVSAQTFDS